MVHEGWSPRTLSISHFATISLTVWVLSKVAWWILDGWAWNVLRTVSLQWLTPLPHSKKAKPQIWSLSPGAYISSASSWWVKYRAPVSLSPLSHMNSRQYRESYQDIFRIFLFTHTAHNGRCPCQTRSHLLEIVCMVWAIGSASVGDYRLPCNWRWLFLHWYHHYMYLDVYNINERVESKLQQAEKSRKQLHSVHQVLTVERKLQHFSSVSQHRERAIWKHERQSREVIRADVKKIFDDRISA